MLSNPRINRSVDLKGKLLVLAASVNQIPIIERAQALGYAVLTLDNNPQNPGHRIADEAVNCDTRDLDSVIQIARREKVGGIIAAATDVALPTAAAVGLALGLPAPSMKAAQTLVIKSSFREFQNKLGLPAPRWAKDPRAFTYPRPAIVKPAAASGSRGIRIVDDMDRLQTLFLEACEISLDGAAIVEEMLPGSQHTIEGIMSAGRIAACLVTDRLTAPAPYTATVGHRVPSTMNRNDQVSCRVQIEAAFSELHYQNGPFDADVVCGPDGPVLIELTARAGGNSLMRLVSVASGFPYIDYLVLNAMGAWNRPIEDFHIRPAGADVLGSAQAGILDYQPKAIDQLRGEPWCEYLAVDLPPLARVAAFADGRARYGELVVTAESKAEVEERIREVKERLQILVS